MKLGNHDLTKPNIEIIPIPRNGKDIYFKAQAILDMDELDTICTPPKPPVRMLPGGKKVEDASDPNYKKSLIANAERRSAWMVIQSLKATENLIWDTVDDADPETWTNYRQELKDANFSEVEIMRIVHGVMVANSLSEDRIIEARERFFQDLEQSPEQESLNQMDVLNSTQSGKPANA